MTNANHNIVLIGFMACGKSKIGKIVAEKLGYQLIDIDSIIEHQQGCSIAEIFNKQGEAYFRQLEQDAIARCAQAHQSVIVTGGGAPMFFKNAHNLACLGPIFFLDASFALIKKRLLKSKKRPLATISQEQDLVQVQDLYCYRRPVYQKLGHSIDVSSEDETLIANDIIERFLALKSLFAIKKTTIHDVNESYPIFHQSNILKDFDTIVQSLGLSSYRPIIVTTELLAHTLKPAIDTLGSSFKVAPKTVTFSDGEQHKRLESVSKIHDQMFKLGCNRFTTVIALGGGNVGDVAGFAAGIFMRGVPFIQVPTTLLSMVDASIGGKTGVDNHYGKNLVGLFYNPKAVVIDPTFLKTLSQEDVACGMAEIIKHAIIGDPLLFNDLKHPFAIDEIIERALRVKADIVFNDPKERNIRAHLNLGHTFAHAIEKVSNFEIKHGIAVAMGLVLATKLSKRLGVLEEDFVPELVSLLQHHGLPTKLPPHLLQQDLVLAMKHDKKRDPKGLKFILPKKIGEVVVQHVDEQDIF